MALSLLFITPKDPNVINKALTPKVKTLQAHRVIKFKSVIEVKEEQTIKVEGIVNNEMADNFIEEFEAKEKLGKPLFIMINSPGGDVEAGLRMVRAIKASKVPTIGYCSQLCASMAYYILEYTDTRLMPIGSTVMGHRLQIGLAMKQTEPLPYIISMLRKLESEEKHINQYVAKRTKLSYRTYMAMINEEIWMDDVDALAAGFIDQSVIIKVIPAPVQDSISKLSPLEDLND